MISCELIWSRTLLHYPQKPRQFTLLIMKRNKTVGFTYKEQIIPRTSKYMEDFFINKRTVSYDIICIGNVCILYFLTVPNSSVEIRNT